jgi:hypothetical protein
MQGKKMGFCTNKYSKVIKLPAPWLEAQENTHKACPALASRQVESTVTWSEA